MKNGYLLRSGLLVLLTALTGVTASCGDIVVSSLKTGLFSFVSGGLSSTFGGGGLNNYVNSVFTGSNTSNTTSTGT